MSAENSSIVPAVTEGVDPVERLRRAYFPPARLMALGEANSLINHSAYSGTDHGTNGGSSAS